MLGLGAAALFLWNNRGASEDAQTDQLTGAAMMAAGEGTSPDSPFQAYSAPANPVFFFNQGGEMAQIPGTNVPRGASTDEDIGVYPGGKNQPELEFTVARGIPPTGTSDISPGNPLFAGSPNADITPSTIWDQQAQIAEANFMPLLGIRDTGGGGIEILGTSVDVATLDSKERIADFAANPIRVANLESGFAFTSTANVLGEYVRGFTGTPAGPVTNQVLVSENPPWAGGDNWWDEG